MSHFQDTDDDVCECGDLHIIGLEMGGCGCGNPGVWQADPYAQELHGENNYSFMCDNCYNLAIQEI